MMWIKYSTLVRFWQLRPSFFIQFNTYCPFTLCALLTQWSDILSTRHTVIKSRSLWCVITWIENYLFKNDFDQDSQLITHTSILFIKKMFADPNLLWQLEKWDLHLIYSFQDQFSGCKCNGFNCDLEHWWT